MDGFDANDPMQDDVYVSLSLSCDGDSQDCLCLLELPAGTQVNTEDEARSWAVKIAGQARAAGWTSSGDVILCPSCTVRARIVGLPLSRYEKARMAIESHRRNLLIEGDASARTSEREK